MSKRELSLLPSDDVSHKDVLSEQLKGTARRREVSLRALGRLVAATGCVVTPYARFPELLPRMIALLKEGTGQHAHPWSLRRELLRTIGQ